MIQHCYVIRWLRRCEFLNQHCADLFDPHSNRHISDRWEQPLKLGFVNLNRQNLRLVAFLRDSSRLKLFNLSRDLITGIPAAQCVTTYYGIISIATSS